MSTQHASTSTLTPERQGLPPPLSLDLTDMDRPVGWVEGDTIGFRGFGSELEAAHAAWVAHRTIARRLARQRGGRSVLIDTEPLTLDTRGDTELVLASGLAIATLLRPGPESRSGPDSFGFELRIPGRADEVTMRSMAYLAYRTLRKSGLRWAMWTSNVRRGSHPVHDELATQDEAYASHGARIGASAIETTRDRPADTRRPAPGAGGPARGFDWGFALLALALLLLMALIIPPIALVPIGAAALGALVFVGALDLLRRRGTRRALGTSPLHGRGVRARSAALPIPGSQKRAGVRVWAAMITVTTVVSIVALLIAAAMPERLALALSAVALVGLAGGRVLAARAGWLPSRRVRVRSVRPESEPAASAEISGRPPREANAGRVQPAASGLTPYAADVPDGRTESRPEGATGGADVERPEHTVAS